MQGVLDLPGLAEPPPKRRSRFYFCLLMDVAAAARLQRLTNGILSDCTWDQRPTSDGWHHLSLHFLRFGEHLPERILYAAEQAARRVVMPPFEITCDAVASLRTLSTKANPFRLILRAEGDALRELYLRLGAAMAQCGLRPSPNFAPHITLAQEAAGRATQIIEPIRIAVRDFALVHSGRLYRVLNRFPLQP